MKVSNIKRIIQEDFDQKDQELVRKLGFALNPMLEQLTQAFDKNIDFDNLNQQIVTIKVRADIDGIVPDGYSEFTHALKTRPKGMICVSAIPEDDSSYATSAPFVTYGFRNGSYNQVVIKHISGLQADKVYTISLLVI